MRDLQPPITDWDRAIMDVYPHRFAPLWSSRENWESFDAMIDWTRQNVEREDFTWKSMTFFFKHEEDAIMFKLRWDP
jgi:hypothetical protein